MQGIEADTRGRAADAAPASGAGACSDPISRRAAIERVALLLGGVALVGQSALLSGCAANRRPPAEPLLTAGDVALLDEVADTILPATSTPGAKDAGVGRFIAIMVEDAYDVRDQRMFVDGLRRLEAASSRLNGAGFMETSPAMRRALLERLDAEQLEHSRARAPGEPAHYFRMIKELTLLGYFTSEIGYLEAMRYVETPGRFDPCVPYAPGERAWAPHA